MNGREKIAKLVIDLRAEADKLRAKIIVLDKLADARCNLADELENTAKERSDEVCELAAAHIPDTCKSSELN